MAIQVGCSALTASRFCTVLVCALLAGCTSGMLAGSVDKTEPAKTSALAFQSDEGFGRGLSEKQKGALSAAEMQALEFGKPGEPVKWGDEKGPVSGSVIVTQPFRVGQSSCRRFTHLLKRKSESQKANGTACRRGGGSWRLVQ